MIYEHGQAAAQRQRVSQTAIWSHLLEPAEKWARLGLGLRYHTARDRSLSLGVRLRDPRYRVGPNLNLLKIVIAVGSSYHAHDDCIWSYSRSRFKHACAVGWDTDHTGN
jgi:hypothetical protein